MRSIQPMEEKYREPALDLLQEVFSESDSPEEGRFVRALAQEIRAGAYYVPELELIMTGEGGEILGYAMFSRFPIEGRYADELLILTPVAVRTACQRQHISRDLIEYGFARAAELGYKAVLVEGDPKNYHARGFETSADHGIIAGPDIHLPHVTCLMVRELVEGALAGIHGTVDYSLYETLRNE